MPLRGGRAPKARTFFARLNAFSMLSRWHLTWCSSCEAVQRPLRRRRQLGVECMSVRPAAGFTTARKRLPAGHSTWTRARCGGGGYIEDFNARSRTD